MGSEVSIQHNRELNAFRVIVNFDSDILFLEDTLDMEWSIKMTVEQANELFTKLHEKLSILDRTIGYELKNKE